MYTCIPVTVCWNVKQIRCNTVCVCVKCNYSSDSIIRRSAIRGICPEAWRRLTYVQQALRASRWNGGREQTHVNGVQRQLLQPSGTFTAPSSSAPRCSLTQKAINIPYYGTSDEEKIVFWGLEIIQNVNERILVNFFSAGWAWSEKKLIRLVSFLWRFGFLCRFNFNFRCVREVAAPLSAEVWELWSLLVSLLFFYFFYLSA